MKLTGSAGGFSCSISCRGCGTKYGNFTALFNCEIKCGVRDFLGKEK